MRCVETALDAIRPILTKPGSFENASSSGVSTSLGGTTSHVPVLRPQLPRAERLLPYLRRIDASRIYTNHGPLVTEFQERLSSLLALPVGGVVAAGTGTAALTGAILAVAGRATAARPFILMPSFTFVATAIAVEGCGYRPYLADVNESQWTMNADALAQHPALAQVAAVVVVAPFGRAVPQEPWRRFREATGLPVVIDGAASFDVLSASPQTFLGDIPVALSFHATKSFATGEGGGVAVADLNLADKVIQCLNFGFCGERDSRSPSINGKMSEYHAAVGLAELDGWPEKRSALQFVADCYRRAAAEAGIAERIMVSPKVGLSYVLFRCAHSAERTAVQQALNGVAVDFRLWYGEGVHRQSYFEGASRDNMDVTDRIAPNLIGLPLALDLSEQTIVNVIERISDVTRATV